MSEKRLSSTTPRSSLIREKQDDDVDTPNRAQSAIIRTSRKASTPRHRASSVGFAPTDSTGRDDRTPTGTPPNNLARSAFGPGGSSLAGSRSPSNPAIVVAVQGQAPKLYHGKHRLSGLFSVDNLSLDLSVTGSDTYRPGLIEQVPGGTGEGGGDREKPPHPVSMAGSSIGSSSWGSGSGLYSMDQRRKNRYKPFRRRWRRFQRKFKGCIFALISSFTSSLAAYFVHSLTGLDTEGNRKYSSSYCMLIRHIGVLLPGILIVLYYRFCAKEMIFDTIWPLQKLETGKKFGISAARAVVDVASLYLNYEAFKYLLQSETSTILNSKPIIVQLLAHFTLGEAWGIVPVVMSCIAAIGVTVMARPPFLVPSKAVNKEDADFLTGRLPGIGYALGSMLLSSVVYCILRYLKDVHYSVFSLFIGSAGVIFGLGMTFGLHEFKMPTDSKEIIYFISVACLTCCSSICIVIALQNEEAFVVSLVRSLDVIFSFLWETSIDHKYPDWYRGGGACIIMFCVVVIFFRKYLSHQDPESTVYKRFEFLTK